MNRASLNSYDRRQLTRIVQDNVIQKHKGLFLNPDNPNSLFKQEEVIRQEIRILLDREDRETETYVIDQLIGYKDLGPFFRDPEITDILINGPDQVYIEKNNRPVKTAIKFESADEVMKILQMAVQKAGRKIDFNHPLVDVRLPDGSRLNAVIVPNCPFPAVSIRKFVQKSFTGKELVDQGFLSEEMLLFFQYAVKAGCNIVIAGATGSGKTTFLRFLCSFIPENERIVTIEDTFELNLEGHVVPLQKSARVDVKDLMVNALRMYPRRIILGEFRGAETFELLQAMGTGHMGSMTTGHANNGRQDLVQRLIRAMMGAGLSDEELTRHILSSIDLTVFIKKFKDGKWCITEVNELVDDHGGPRFEEVYKFNRSTGRHEAVKSLSPALLERLQDELGNEKLPGIKPFSNLYKPRGVVAL
ncbi:MAG: CpaF family protein [Bacillota bacterium]